MHLTPPLRTRATGATVRTGAVIDLMLLGDPASWHDSITRRRNSSIKAPAWLLLRIMQSHRLTNRVRTRGLELRSESDVDQSSSCHRGSGVAGVMQATIPVLPRDSCSLRRSCGMPDGLARGSSFQRLDADHRVLVSCRRTRLGGLVSDHARSYLSTIRSFCRSRPRWGQTRVLLESPSLPTRTTGIDLW